MGKRLWLLFISCSMFAAGCSGSSGGGGGTPSTYSVGGTVSGLLGTGLVLQNNGGDDLAISADGTFTFATKLADATAYAVMVATQPTNPNQTCTVSGGTGTVSGANVNNVTVTCTTNTYTIGGTVTGLAGTGLELQNNGGDDLTVSADGAFAFATALEDGTAFSVTITSQPINPNQTCALSGETGTVNGANVTSVTVSCTTDTYTIGGMVSGLSGSGLVLQNNGGDDLTLNSSGIFTFATSVADQGAYAVTVSTQPSSPSHTCYVVNGSGTVAGANVTSVEVHCPQVDPLYPSNGANWNDFVLRTGTTNLDADDTACVGTEQRFDACIHGALFRTVTLPGYSSCTGITASDNLGWFDWICDDTVDPVRVVSMGFIVGKSFADTLDFGTPGILGNHVIVQENSNPLADTPSTVWWSNPVIDASLGGPLNTVSAVYVVPSSVVQAMDFIADRASLVVAPSATLSASGATTDVVSALGYKFLYIEGAIDASGAQSGVRLAAATSFVHLVNVSVSGADQNTVGAGLWVKNSTSIQVDGLAATGNLQGVWLDTADDNALNNVIVTNSGADGVRLSEADSNTFGSVRVMGSGGQGVLIEGGSTDSTGNVFDGLVMGGCTGNGLRVFQATANTFRNVATYSNGGSGVLVENASLQTRLFGVRASDNGNRGIIYTGGSDSARIQGVIATNNAASGVEISGSHAAVVFDVYASNNSGTGVALVISNDSVLANATTVNNAVRGAWLETAPNVLVQGILSANNTVDGVLVFNGSDNATLWDVMSTNNGVYGVNLDSSEDVIFGGLLKVGNNATADCNVNNVTNAGLDGSCGNAGSSSATLTTSATAASSFVGKVTTDDATNQSDTNGAAAYDDPITDWVSFDNDARGWGLDGSAFPNADHVGAATGTDACRIWDWSLASADTVARALFSLPTGNDTLSHTFSGGGVTFLMHAPEDLGDGVGDDDGLCESSETCRFSPNIGAYQGHGGVSAATFTDGTITGVTLQQAASNGR